MAHRKISSIIDDMISQRLLTTSTDNKVKIQKAERALDQLKNELEHSLGALVSDYIQGLKDAGLIK